MKKRVLGIVMAAVMLIGMAVPAGAASVTVGDQRVVIGANLTSEQKTQVYEDFGITEGSVSELTVTNAEEREYLEGVADESVIGTKSYSCVYIIVLEDDAGLDISINNINWCTEEIYSNALVTAGIYNAKVVITAPFEVSGTAALTGIYKAYEDITGETLDTTAKEVAVTELVITSELADEIGSADATAIVNELKLILDETDDMTDDELKEEINSIASELDITLSDSEVESLVELVRSLSELDTSVLVNAVETVQSFVTSIAGSDSSDSGIVSSLFTAVKNFFTSIGNWFAGLFGN